MCKITKKKRTEKIFIYLFAFLLHIHIVAIDATLESTSVFENKFCFSFCS